jgi:arabinofuranosyltransferase
VDALHLAARAVPFLLVALYTITIAHNAWVSDDAYITFRTIDNWSRGYGLTWNPGERVQPYTHPLWMLLMAALHRMSGEFYLTSIGLGLVVSLAVVLIVARAAASAPHAAALALVACCFSRAFTDYSTSGLENPLSHLLLVGFLWIYFGDERRPRRFLALAGIFGLALVNRLDAALLLLPPLVAAFLRLPNRREKLGDLAAGLAPFLAWEVFSVVYYGLPIPNSALAKLRTGIGWHELVPQGFFYVVNSVRWDPITLATVATGAALPLLRRDRRALAVGIGVLLHLAYVVRVGGDFMSGRFFTTPFVAAIVLLARSDLRPRLAWPVAAAVAVLLSCNADTFLLRTRSYGVTWDAAIDAHGVADERSYYEHETGLRFRRDRRDWPKPEAVVEAYTLKKTWNNDDPILRHLKAWTLLSPREAWPPGPAQPGAAPIRPVAIRGAIGFVPYYLGPEFYVLDYHALANPLLAMLPAADSDPILALLVPRLAHLKWRIGHFLRIIPEGYVETLATGRNCIRDPDLAYFYDRLALITRGRLLDPERLRAIVALNLGRYDNRVRSYLAHYSPPSS